MRDDLNMRECECPSTAVATSNYSLEGHKGVIFCIRWIGDGRKVRISIGTTIFLLIELITNIYIGTSCLLCLLCLENSCADDVLFIR